jgi:2-phosphoglycerate kinase
MPTDLSPHPEQGIISVEDRAGVGLPFSKGLMATSILATGVETDRAYRLAKQIEQRLRNQNVNRISADELSECAEAAIRSEESVEAAQRYRAWRRIKRTGRPVIIVLSGAPGVGKSTVATRLAVRLGITRVVTTDTIREVLRSIVPPTVLPELHLSTYETLDPAVHAGVGNDPLGTFHAQARAVGAATASVARRLCAERRSAILEGVHLIPRSISQQIASESNQPIVVEMTLALADEELHRGHLEYRATSEPNRAGNRHLSYFDAIRAVQNELIRLSTAASVPVFDLANPERLTQSLVDTIASRVFAHPEIA